MLGTIVNAAAILVGGSLGLLLKKGIPERVSSGIVQGLALIVLYGAMTVERKNGDPIGSIPWRALICVVGAIVFFGFFLPRLGFLISFPTMIIITSAGGKEFTWKDAILNAAILTVLSYAIFIYGLQLTIPVWPA